jgi:hypothetical protein
MGHIGQVEVFGAGEIVVAVLIRVFFTVVLVVALNSIMMFGVIRIVRWQAQNEVEEDGETVEAQQLLLTRDG